MKVSEGYRIADSRNLPKVDYLMLLEYMHESDCYNVAETQSAKALLASREAYVDTAVGYVEVQREGTLCNVKCRVTHEHKIKGKLYIVTATIDETLKKIVKVECNDCASSAGGCKHAICFAMWLIKRSDEPSVTSTICYWNKPKLAGAISDKKHVMAKNMGIPKKTRPTNVNFPSLTMFLAECTQRNMYKGLILRQSQDHNKPNLQDLTIFNLMLKYIIETKNNLTCSGFKLFAKNIVTTEIINEIATQTNEQANSKLWHAIRQGRVTGSKIYEAVHCKAANGALVQSILGGYKVPETCAIKRGKLLEQRVLKELESEFGSIERTGLILISPIIGVSPDGITNDFVVEVKCPISETTMKNYIKDGQLQEKFKTQIMVQMHGANKLKGLFCIADPTFEQSKVLHKYWVHYDEDYVKKILISAEDFWENYIYQTILDSAK